MGVEVVGFEMVQGPVEAFNEGENSVLPSKENGKLDEGSALKEPIKFGTHGDEPVKEEGNDVTGANFPKDAADEWPAPKQIHSFYLIRYRSYDDPNIKAKIDLADREIQKRNQSRYQITEALKAKRSDRAELISQIKALKDDNRQIKTIVDEKIKEIEPLQQALGKLRNANNAGRGSGLCSSEEELDNLIYSIKYRMQHESISLVEEKQLMKEIKQLEGTREKVAANAAVRMKVQDSLVHKEALQDQVKIIGGDLDGVRKEQQTVRGKIKQLDDALKIIDKDIKSLQDELTAVTEKRDKSYESIQHLRKKRDEGNAYFYQGRALMNKARELAAKKDIRGLEELSYLEVEKFMSLWNNDKAFRDDYEKRILPSLDSRQLSRDGRMRNPDEKPLVISEEAKPSETVIVAKANTKQVKEDTKLIPVDASPAPKVQKEVKSKATESKPIIIERSEKEDEIPVVEKPKIEIPPKDKKIDEAKLKEIKREEEIAKAKQALERKKKLAEKAAAKAAIRDQKEAEKKLKAQEKKAKKKATASEPASEEPADAAVEEAPEAEKADENVEAPPQAREKAQKDNSNTIRSRGRPKGGNAVPKMVLKRKKSTNFWVWPPPPVALLVLAVIVLGLLLLLLY